ncbi:hypothetical protein RN001_004366 [Aquatica leii]|uniref:Protoporphyrinogen oxidase n=1 Tax=Aquatica leii TaxID=1421715 RepID=A0AAN7PZV2_9COLE|nr:hypothetical protein RN001_004366 [Aquatica leii]
MSKVILGGGISGLSAAFYLRKKFPLLSITLLEASNRNGGWIKSEKHDGYIFEQGPRTIRPHGNKAINTLDLIEDIGLTNEVEYLPKNHPAALNRMVYVDGVLHKLPSSFSSLLTKNPPFTKPLVQYLIKEFRQTSKTVHDESIYDFVKRRFGSEIADYAISPLICGICAGDAKRISVKFLLENLFYDEQKYGSITKGFIKNIFKKQPQPVILNTLARRAKSEKWNVFFFKDGLEVFPKRLEKVNKENNVDIRVNQSCTSIELNPTKVTLHMDSNNKVETRHLIATISAKKLSELIIGHADLTKLLSSIPFVTVCVINLHYKTELLKQEAFGFLIPPKENLPILGVIFDSCCFPCEGCTNLTVMMGGHWFKTFFGENPTDEHLLDVALKQLEDILKIKDKPNSFKINVLKNCIPQYIVGHNETVDKIHKYVEDNKLPLNLCGTSYNGVGINDAVYSAKTMVDKLQN